LNNNNDRAKRHNNTRGRQREGHTKEKKERK
jgi:hypothetical protein